MASAMLGVPGCCDCESPGCTATLGGNVSACLDLIGGATVVLTWSGGGATVTTDSLGHFTFSNPSTGADVTVSYSISYPGLVTATGTATATCLHGWTFSDVILLPDDDHICLCGCNKPLPKTLTLTNSKGSTTLTWSAPNAWYEGVITWTEAEGCILQSVDSDGLPGGPQCSCAVKSSVTAKLTYRLQCSGGHWRLVVGSNFAGRHTGSDPNGCYGATGPCQANDPTNWRASGRFIDNGAPVCTANSATQPVDCDSPISLTFSFTLSLLCAGVAWPIETPTTASVTA